MASTTSSLKRTAHESSSSAASSSPCSPYPLASSNKILRPSSDLGQCSASVLAGLAFLNPTNNSAEHSSDKNLSALLMNDPSPVPENAEGGGETMKLNNNNNNSSSSTHHNTASGGEMDEDEEEVSVDAGSDSFLMEEAAALGFGEASSSPDISSGGVKGQHHQQWSYEEQFKQLYELSDDPKRREFLDDLFRFMQTRGTPVNRIPIMAKHVLDLYKLYRLVVSKGGLVEVINKKLWREITKGLDLPSSITSAAFTLRTQYMKYLYPYECEKLRLSNPNELTAAIDGNRREARRPSYSFDYPFMFATRPPGVPPVPSSTSAGCAAPPGGLVRSDTSTPVSLGGGVSLPTGMFRNPGATGVSTTLTSTSTPGFLVPPMNTVCSSSSLSASMLKPDSILSTARSTAGEGPSLPFSAPPNAFLRQPPPPALIAAMAAAAAESSSSFPNTSAMQQFLNTSGWPASTGAAPHLLLPSVSAPTTSTPTSPAATRPSLPNGQPFLSTPSTSSLLATMGPLATAQLAAALMNSNKGPLGIPPHPLTPMDALLAAAALTSSQQPSGHPMQHHSPSRLLPLMFPGIMPLGSVPTAFPPVKAESVTEVLSGHNTEAKDANEGKDMNDHESSSNPLSLTNKPLPMPPDWMRALLPSVVRSAATTSKDNSEEEKFHNSKDSTESEDDHKEDLLPPLLVHSTQNSGKLFATGDDSGGSTKFDMAALSSSPGAVEEMVTEESQPSVESGSTEENSAPLRASIVHRDQDDTQHDIFSIHNLHGNHGQALSLGPNKQIKISTQTGLPGNSLLMCLELNGTSYHGVLFPQHKGAPGNHSVVL